MSSSKNRVNRASQFKKGIDGEESRRRREDSSVQLRKNRAAEQIAKRRHRNVSENGADDGDGAAPYDPNIEEKLKLLPNYVMQIKSGDGSQQQDAVMNIRKLLSIERNPPIQTVIDSGIVFNLVNFLTANNNPTLQFEASWALTNIASGTSENTRVVVEAGAVPIFVQLLRSPHAEVREQAVWALGNIAGDSPECRDLVLRSGALQPLLQLCVPNSKLSLLRNATWTLSNLCRGKPQPPFEQVSPALQVLANLVWTKDEEVLTDACWALSYLSDDTGPNNFKIQAVIHSGVARRLVELLLHKNVNVKTPALRTVGNIVTGDDMQTQVIIHCGALGVLLQLLGHPKKGIQKEACWTISNITAGNKDQIQAVLDANIIPPLVHILKTATFDIQKEAVWAICNATSGGTDQQIRFLVQQGCIPPICNLLTCRDAKIVLVCLEGIENILRVGAKDAVRENTENRYADFVEECGGMDKLEGLQRHPNEDIYNKVQKIMRTYMKLETDDTAEDTTLAPTQNAGGFSFGAGPTGGTGGFNFGN